MARTRHVPERTCIVCRLKKPKRELTRIVRSPQGEVEVDPTGKANGRGAYLCSDPAQWAEAVTKGRLAHVLETTLSPEQKTRLMQYAEALEAGTST